ncbi:hypothetical protein DY218_05710 [Streptomyces triticagri]|uniref:Uncharacterized protein n=1 Tax=Streptomyces triticagri TaxID=2293568 RepID=A0A372MAW7_9ACTN|nr:hypothetical protein [Streptomyces triticagri]RFU87750.1 hypothetical protein DY218_05710 [Streptomyces triticagri]
MAVFVGVVCLVVVAGVVWLLARLDSWRPAGLERWNRARGRCPGCGSGRTRTIVSDNRLNGMLECKACSRAWHPDPDSHPPAGP